MEKRGVIDEGTTPDLGRVLDTLDDRAQCESVKQASDVEAADEDLTHQMAKIVEHQIRN